jgi:aspartate/methionine/tyrosine aminotransferase
VKARETILERNRAIIAANLPVFESFFTEFHSLFDWHAPDGGCVTYLRYKGADGVEQFCADLVNEAGVLLLPASIYRSQLTVTPPDHFRVGVGRSDPEPGLDAFRAWLRARA